MGRPVKVVKCGLNPYNAFIVFKDNLMWRVVASPRLQYDLRLIIKKVESSHVVPHVIENDNPLDSCTLCDTLFLSLSVVRQLRFLSIAELKIEAPLAVSDRYEVHVKGLVILSRQAEILHRVLREQIRRSSHLELLGSVWSYLFLFLLLGHGLVLHSLDRQDLVYVLLNLTDCVLNHRVEFGESFIFDLVDLVNFVF